jgi:hypothetical protein
MTLLSQLNNIATDLQTAKNNIATAITAKGVSASGDDTLANLVTKIGNITPQPVYDYDTFTFYEYKNVGSSASSSSGMQLIYTVNSTAFTTSTTLNGYLWNKSNYLYIKPPTKTGYTTPILLSFFLQLIATTGATSTSGDIPFFISVKFNANNSNFQNLCSRTVSQNNRSALYLRESLNSTNGTLEDTAYNSLPYLSNYSDTSNVRIYTASHSSTNDTLRSFFRLQATFAYKKTT